MPKTHDEVRPVSLTLPADLIQRLDERAEREMISRAAVARQLLAAALRTEEAAA